MKLIHWRISLFFCPYCSDLLLLSCLCTLSYFLFLYLLISFCLYLTLVMSLYFPSRSPLSSLPPPPLLPSSIPLSSPPVLPPLQGVDGEAFEWQPVQWSSPEESSRLSSYSVSSQYCATVDCRWVSGLQTSLSVKEITGTLNCHCKSFLFLFLHTGRKGFVVELLYSMCVIIIW